MKFIMTEKSAVKQLDIIEQLEKVVGYLKFHARLRQMSIDSLEAYKYNEVLAKRYAHNIMIYNMCIMRWNERMDRLINQLQE